MTAQAPESLRFDLIAPAEVRLGEAVTIMLRLTNVSDHPVEAHFLGREIAFDIVVTRAEVGVAWQRLRGAAVPSILQVRTLMTGEVMAWEDVWRPAARGSYRLQGILPSDEPEPRRTPPVELLVR
ncbi:MAG: hypothetical protein HY560_07715 [Gemmatimonadetes bacterium]|nr:hypothetical protein [Gemmatimonadota bacterium]